MRILACDCIICWPWPESLRKKSPSLCCHAPLYGCPDFSAHSAMPGGDILKQHGLKERSKKDVTSKACFYFRVGDYRAASKAGKREQWTPARGRSGWRRNPVRWFSCWSQLIVKPHPGLSRTFLPSSWPQQYIPASTPQLWQLLLSGQVPRLATCMAARSGEAWVTLGPFLGTACDQDLSKAVVKLHSSCWGLPCYCQYAVDEIWPQQNQLQTFGDGAGPGFLLVLQIVSLLIETFFFLLEGAGLLRDNLEFPVLIVSPTSSSVLLVCFVFCIAWLLYNRVLLRKGLI